MHLARLAHSCQYNHMHNEIVLVQNAHSNQWSTWQFKMASFEKQYSFFYLPLSWFSSVSFFIVQKLYFDFIHSAKEWCYHYAVLVALLGVATYILVSCPDNSSTYAIYNIVSYHRELHAMHYGISRIMVNNEQYFLVSQTT